MNTGWIKLHRKILEEGWLKNQKLLPVLLYCLLKASHTHHSFTVGNQKVKLKPGQFVFGRKSAAIELGMSEGSIIRRMENLKKMEIVITEPNNKFTLVTVCNWEIYQSDKSSNRSSNRSVTDQQPINKQVHNRSTTDHKQECKNVKKGENEKNGRSNATVLGSPSIPESEEQLSTAKNNGTSSHPTATEGAVSSKPDDLVSRHQTRLESSVAQPTDEDDPKADSNSVTDYVTNLNFDEEQNTNPIDSLVFQYPDYWEELYRDLYSSTFRLTELKEMEDCLLILDKIISKVEKAKHLSKDQKQLQWGQFGGIKVVLEGKIKRLKYPKVEQKPKPEKTEKPMDMAEYLVSV